METKPVEPSVWEKYAPSLGQAWSFALHIGSFGAGAVGATTATLVTLHAATPEQATTLVNSFNDMVGHATGFIEAGSVFFGTAMGVYAGVRRSVGSMIAATRVLPGVEGVAIDHNATGPAAEAAADPSMPNVKKGVVVAVAAPPPQPTLLGKEAT